MTIKLDYTILDVQERKKIVEQICSEHQSELTEKNLETLSDYLINCVKKEERKQRKIMTQNRKTTIDKRETSLEGLVGKFENGEDGVYQMFGDNDKNVLLTPKISITKKDLETIPYLKQIKESIAALKTIEKKNYIVCQNIIDLSQTQYIIKEAYTKPVRTSSFMKNQPAEFDWDKYLDFSDWHCVAAFLKFYPALAARNKEKIAKDMRWIIEDFENLLKRALKEKEPMLYDIVLMKFNNFLNIDIQLKLQEKYGKSYSIEYISSLYNNKIPKLIAVANQKEYLEWYYTEVEKGNWKKCNKCGQIKLLHNIFFSKNSSSKNGFYSICKECRTTKKKGC